jgi:hypothetical protein
VFIVVIYSIIDSVRKILDTPSYRRSSPVIVRIFLTPLRMKGDFEIGVIGTVPTPNDQQQPFSQKRRPPQIL